MPRGPPGSPKCSGMLQSAADAVAVVAVVVPVVAVVVSVDATLVSTAKWWEERRPNYPRVINADFGRGCGAKRREGLYKLLTDCHA